MTIASLPIAAPPVPTLLLLLALVDPPAPVVLVEADPGFVSSPLHAARESAVSAVRAQSNPIIFMCIPPE
jgi:hypothetical protein